MEINMNSTIAAYQLTFSHIQKRIKLPVLSKKKKIIFEI